MNALRFWSLEPEANAHVNIAKAESIEYVPCPRMPNDHSIEKNPQYRFDLDRDPLNIVIGSKRKAEADFVKAGIHLLISDRVLRMFEEQQFTGFIVRPVKVTMRIPRTKRAQQANECETGKQVTPPIFWELLNIGWGGLAPRASGIRLRRRCKGCNYQEYTGFTNPSRLVDEAQWDGSDILLVWPMPVYVIVTERVARFILDNKLTGVKPVPVEAPEWPGHVIHGLSPGRLREWLPEPRAREIGEPLGIY